MGKNELILGLVRCQFLSCREKEFLAKKLDNLESLTVLSIEDICVMVGRNIRTRDWKRDLLKDFVDQDLAIMQSFGIRFVPIMSGDYPPLLRETHEPPFALFWRGTLPDPETPLVALVGTRSPSGTGSLAAARLGKEFAKGGIPVVSGLARGVDAFAHRGNLEGGGKTVAVLACGVERVYPRSNACLASRLVDSGGCLLSEYSPGEAPLQYRFPQRNRIIAGLARATIVVEAPEKSGALITADFALNEGRDLFVVRETLESLRGAGIRRLYEEGAPAIDGADDVLSSWGRAIVSPDLGDCPREGHPDGAPSYAAKVGKQLAFEFRKEMALDSKSY